MTEPHQRSTKKTSPIKSLIFSDDKRQAIRISRLLISTSAYLLSFLLICLSYWLGYMEAWVIGFGAFSVIASACGFYVWMRTGLNLRMADPSLTMIQMVVSTLVIMVLIYNAIHTRGPFLIIYLVVFLFGIFRLNTRQFMALSAFVLSTYGAVIFLLAQYHPEKISLYEDILQWVALAALLPFFGVLGGYISSLRSKLRKQHDELTNALTIIQEMAIHDELTGLFNRRQLMALLGKEQTRADRSGQLFCVLMVDIDHFKKVNDSLGHLAGDKVLKETAKAIQNSLRAVDFCGRYGGEEFVLIAGQTTKNGAIVCAERLRGIIESIKFPDLAEGFQVTISVGITEYRLREEISETIDRADKALYRAKSAGRNRVECG